MKIFKDQLGNLKDLLSKAEKGETKEVTETASAALQFEDQKIQEQFKTQEKEIQEVKEKYEKKLKDYEEKNENLKTKQERFTDYDSKILGLLNKKDFNIILNVGGEVFISKLSTLISEKDTLFYKLIFFKLNKNLKLDEPMFFDRSPQMFRAILNFLRTKKFNLDLYSYNEIEDLKAESEFYGITRLIEATKDFVEEVVLVNFESAPRHTAGTYNLDDISDRSMMRGGICVQSPYFITFTLNRIVEIAEIEIGGYKGNTNSWSSSNGNNAKIFTSTDKENWKEVGKIPSFGANPVKTTLTKSPALFLKFQHTTYLGIGYLKITKY